MTAFHEITQAQMLPRVVRLGEGLYGCVFSLMKLVPARYILRKAVARGDLGPETTIVETTSGTFGLALAMQATLLGRRFVLVSDPVIDPGLRRRLTDLGAEVVICETPLAVGGYQAARLQRLAELRAEHPDTFCPEQYANPDNPASYAAVAEVIEESLGAVDCVVGSVGSGGSMCGTVGALRTRDDAVRAIAVDTPSSVLFGQPDGPRTLRGLGNSLLPPNLDHSVFDEVHWCTEAEAFASTRSLHRAHALFQGPTSGAAYRVGRWWAEQNPGGRCVVLLPDEGYRYLDTVYDDRWLAAHGYAGAAQRETGPRDVTDPTRPMTGWARYRWGRRAYDEVLGAAARTSGLEPVR